MADLKNTDINKADAKKDVVGEMLILLQRKFKHLDEFYNSTTQLAEALNRNDDVSTQIMFELREDSMNAIDEIDETMYEIIDGLDNYLRLEVNRQLSVEEFISEDTKINKIGELFRRNKRLVERTIVVDRIINQKIGGAESFYSHKSE